MKYNHNRPLSDFQDDIDEIKASGYTPIAVSQMYLEDVFVFETDEEAHNAYLHFEKQEKTIIGWWYGRESFMEEVEEYERDSDGDVKIHWL